MFSAKYFAWVFLLSYLLATEDMTSRQLSNFDSAKLNIAVKQIWRSYQFLWKWRSLDQTDFYLSYPKIEFL